MLKINSSLIEIGEDYLSKYNYFSKKIYNFENINDLIISIKNKKTILILSGEKVNVNILNIPKVKLNELHNIVTHEVYYNFRDTKNLMIAYTLFKKDINNDQFAVLCINNKKLSMIYNKFSKNISNIYIVQLCVLNYFNKKIKDKDFIFLFQYKDNLYFLYCVNDILIYNNIIKIIDIQEGIEKFIYNFLEESKKYYNTNIKTIYYANINIDISKLKRENFSYQNLGNFDRENLFKNIIINRR
ncbi:hypothetical protein SAMN05428976_102373 [Clostridium sp. USBA 49]|jgi:hypothetical protein|uniref:hypothetical protein n=1 Tax=Clostridium TaxID=1485 RepID=UPI00099A8AB3|nr:MULTISPECIES: hypothetical protein [Clostridium]SKA76856.1 hypothetical protein SAMN05428976_102373 [Clostridium sp. USBA 49]